MIINDIEIIKTFKKMFNTFKSQHIQCNEERWVKIIPIKHWEKMITKWSLTAIHINEL